MPQLSQFLAVQLLLLGAVLLAFGPQDATAEQCIRYTPKSCALPDVTLTNDLCKPKCRFPIGSTFSCMIREWGTFKENKASKCSDPFMSSAYTPVPQCGSRCCRADLNGAFQLPSTVNDTLGLDLRRVYQPFSPTNTAPGTTTTALSGPSTPAGVCQYADINRAQMLQYLRSTNTGILIVGDSMLRGMYLRFLKLMRGGSRFIDPRIQTHFMYRLCSNADAYRFSYNNGKPFSADPQLDYLSGGIITRFFNMSKKAGPGLDIMNQVLANCPGPPVKVDYMFAPRYMVQKDAIYKYFGTVPATEKPVVILNVGYWDDQIYNVPAYYFDMLKFLKPRTSKVFIVTTARAKVSKVEEASRYNKRNYQLRKWAREHGKAYSVLDFDKLSFAPNAPVGITRNDKHYVCSVYWSFLSLDTDAYRSTTSLVGSNNTVVMKNEIRKVTVTEGGQCEDEMNRNMWQLVFNTLIP